MVEPIIGDWRKEKKAINEAGEAIEEAGEQAEDRPAAASRSSQGVSDDMNLC